MTKSPASQLIESVMRGMSPRKAINESALCRCKNYRSDVGSCRTGCAGAHVKPGDMCPWGSDDQEAKGEKSGSSGCPCYK